MPLDVKGVGRAKDTTGCARPVSGLLRRLWSKVRLSRLLRGFDLAADFAAWVLRGMHVDVPFAREQIFFLRVGQRRMTLDRARQVGCGDWNCHAGVLADRCWTMEVSHCGWAGQVRVHDVPLQFLSRRVVRTRQLSVAIAGLRRHFGGGRQVGVHVQHVRHGDEWRSESNRQSECEKSKVPFH